MKKILYILIVATSFILTLCYLINKDKSESCNVVWYNDGQCNNNDIDVFYVASTDVISAVGLDGVKCYTAAMNDADMLAVRGELDFVYKNIFPDSLNFYAPYYHQYTLEAVSLPKERFDSVSSIVEAEICKTFDYYMKHYNGGRRFILAGFSQGGQMVKALLKHMSDEQYSRMVVAYIMGFGVNKNDLNCNHIIPATSADDKGVVVSFNTVADTSYMWSFVQDSSVVCINPVNWSIGSDIASFNYKDSLVSVSIDTTHSVIIAKGFTEEHLSFCTPWPSGCLHHYDLLFYVPMLRQNAIDRSK